jgi:hypothetical protein
MVAAAARVTFDCPRKKVDCRLAGVAWNIALSHNTQLLKSRRKVFPDIFSNASAQNYRGFFGGFQYIQGTATATETGQLSGMSAVRVEFTKTNRVSILKNAPGLSGRFAPTAYSQWSGTDIERQQRGLHVRTPPDAPEMPPGVISGHPGRRSDREGPIKGCRSPFPHDY